MPDPYQRLKERVSALGNHHQKYLRSIDAKIQDLVRALEDRNQLDQVRLWRSAQDPPAEMALVAELSKEAEEKADLLGCYYSLQFLHMNLRLTDVLNLNVTSGRDRLDVYRDFMIQSGLSFRALTAGYMSRLLDLFIEEERRPEFVICGVGSRSDQDDIDVGIVDEGPQKREEFNRAVGRLRNEMMKHASSLHFYLSEHVGTKAYSASLLEYRELLDREIHDFIIITEMLGAARIIGSRRLFDQFKREITWRYHYAPLQDNRFHEAYLRGILGEIRALLLREMEPGGIHLKDDGLRLLKGMIYVQKTIFRIDKVNAWDILQLLRIKDPARREVYDNIDRSLTFLEIFRHLYNLYVVQEEELSPLDRSFADYLGPVARAMGYRDLGAVRAWEQALVHYHESVRAARDNVAILLKDVTDHLRSVSVFAGFEHRHPPAGRYETLRRNPAVDFIVSSRFFRGTKFWDDVLETAATEDGRLLHGIVNGFACLAPRLRARIVRDYAQAGTASFYTFISFLVLLARHRKRTEHRRLFEELSAAFLEAAQKTEARLSSLSRLFHHYPQLINNYLGALNESGLNRFERLLEGETWETRVTSATGKLKKLCHLHLSRSLYFKRYFFRVVQRYPEYLQYLDDTGRLREIAKGLLGILDSLDSFEQRRKTLGEYYDLEYLRVGLNTLEGADLGITNPEFTEFSDTYLQTLFDICKQQVEAELGKEVATRDLLAFFVAGGHAREQAYDDDYDIFILLDSGDESMRRHCDRIVTLMNADIIRRGTLPHYRFADHFGHYVTLMGEMEELLRRGGEGTFIDKSQILGSRLVIGSSRFDKEFEDRIIRPHIFEQSAAYIAEMAEEMRSRRRSHAGADPGSVDMKESAGGLRDIEMVLLVWKARHGLREPINRKLIRSLCRLRPDLAADFEALSGAFDFLKNVRDVYRLTVSAEDTFRPEYLGRAARILGFEHRETAPPEERLLAAYRERTAAAAGIIDRLLRNAGE